MVALIALSKIYSHVFIKVWAKREDKKEVLQVVLRIFGE